MPEQPTITLDIHIVSPAVPQSDFYDADEPWPEPDEFRREIERAVARVIGHFLHVEIMIESEWYFSAWPCPQAVRQQQSGDGWIDEPCGQPTTRRERHFIQPRVIRVCTDGHETPADQFAQSEAGS